MKKLFALWCALVALLWSPEAFAENSNSRGNASQSDLAAQYIGPEYAANENFLVEGCQGGWIEITRPNGPSGSLDFSIQCNGIAINGLDCTALANSLNLPAGQDLMIIPIEALSDNEDEGTELMTIQIACLQVQGFYFELTLEFRDVTPLLVDASPIEIYCDQEAVLTLEITGGSGLTTVEWASQDVGNPLIIQDPTPGNIAFTVTDVCSVVPVATGAIEISFIPYPAMEVNVGPDVTVNCLQDVAIGINPTGGNGDYQIQWYVNGSPSAANTDESFLWTSPVNATVSVVVTDACNNASTDEMQVVLFNQPPTLNIGADVQGNCLDVQNISAQVTGGLGASNVAWYYNNEFIGEGLLISFATSQGGILVAQAEDACASIGTDDMVVVQSSVALTVDIDPIFGMCQDEIPVTAQVGGGVGTDYTYEWSLQGNIISTESSAVVTALPNEWVSIFVSDVCGNHQTAETEIILDIQNINVSVAETFHAADCGQSWQLPSPLVNGGTGNYNYQWSFGSEVLSQNEIIILDVTNHHNHWIELVVTDECTNWGSDSMLIFIDLPSVQIDVATEWSFDCAEPFLIEPSVEGGAGNYTYQWIVEENTTSNQSTWTGTAISSQVIQLVVADACGLMANEEINFAVQPTNLTAQIIADDTSICPNQQVGLLLDLDNVVGELNILWSNGNHEEMTEVVVMDDMVIACDIVDICGNTTHPTFALSIMESNGAFTITNDFMLCHGYESGPMATGGFEPYVYTFDSESIALSDNGVRAIGTSEVLVTVTDACGNLGHVEVDSRSCDFIVPNVFTPNNDAKNDTFEINGLEKYPNSSLVVFNRDGLKVFESDNYKNDWSADGLPSGTYFLILRRNDGELFESSVAVLR
jgi:gliding motility-associated-like protein